MVEDIDELLEDNDQHEQRVYPRRDVKWKVAIKDKQTGRIIPAITVNVSEQGVLLATSVGFKKLQIIPIMINIYHSSGKLIVYATAEVRHVVIRKSDFHIGAQFKKIQPKDQAFLAKFAERAI